jgi:hypothetical protein
MVGQSTIAAGIDSIIAQFGVLGILAWFLWYRVSVADPKQQQAFATGQAKQAEQHKQDYQALLRQSLESHERCEEKFEVLIREQRDESKKQIATLHAIVGSLQSAPQRGGDEPE